MSGKPTLALDASAARPCPGAEPALAEARFERCWPSPLDPARRYGMAGDLFYRIALREAADAPARRQDLRTEADLLRRCQGIPAPMSSQIAALLIDVLPTVARILGTAASRWSEASGQTAGSPSAPPPRWAGAGLRAIYPAVVAVACPVITQSAGTRWNGSPAGRDFG